MDNKVYIEREVLLNMLNRFFRELEGHEAQTLVSDIKHAALELPAATDCPNCGTKFNQEEA